MSEAAKNRERGLKAAIHNPRVSEEAKQHDRELLASEFGEQAEDLPPAGAGGSRRRSSTSKKSASTGPPSAEAAAAEEGAAAAAPGTATTKARRASSGEAGSSLQQMPVEEEHEKDRGHVIRGLKAALKNPHVSEAAKEADRKKLQELGETVE